MEPVTARWWCEGAGGGSVKVLTDVCGATTVDVTTVGGDGHGGGTGRLISVAATIITATRAISATTAPAIASHGGRGGGGSAG